MAAITAQIYSPRWGHNDTYEFELTQEAMNITMGARGSRCEWREGADPEWQGEPLEDILGNDSIYPPAILPNLLEYLWTSWRNGEIDDAEAQVELNIVAEWINTITREKPNTDFWGRYF